MDSTNAVIIWYINGNIYNYNSSVQPDIVVNGGALSSNSSLTIPGYPQYNNTVVKCIAPGFVDGNNYFNFSESTLRIQGNTLSDICHYISSH